MKPGPGAVLSTDEIARKLAAALGPRPGVVFAYLFGSHAEGRAHDKSDVDVAVWMREPYANDGLETLLDLIATVTGALRRDDVDVVILNEAPLTLAHSALKGRLLFSHDEEERIQVESLLMRRHHDRAYYREGYLQAIGRRLAERGFS